MNRQNRSAVVAPDVFDTLSAAWILASNDENPIMTYEGIRHRLNLPASFDVRALIQSRGELFRRGVPSSRLGEWKEEMLAGRHRPSWILDIEEKGAREQAIAALTPDDVFRSQFRAERDASRAPIELIEWGLDHIDRLRKASMEAREQSAKSWQMWLVFVVAAINVVVTIVAR